MSAPEAAARTPAPALSVVMPVRDVATTLEEALDAVLAQRWDRPFEVVIVDNGSHDGTLELSRARAARDPRVRVLEAAERSGVSYARNAGITAARADRIAVCDGDDVVGDGWLAAIGDALDHHRVVTGPLELERLNEPWLAASRGYRTTHGISTFHGLFPYAAGGNLGLRRDVWRAVGGFDVDLPRAQDIEFSMRLWQAGIEIAFAPDAIVHYRYRSGVRDLWHQGLGFGRSRVLVARLLRDRGLPRPPRLAGWKSWAWLVVHLPDVRTSTGRARWLWVAGNRVGHLEGSVRQRVLFL